MGPFLNPVFAPSIDVGDVRTVASTVHDHPFPNQKNKPDLVTDSDEHGNSTETNLPDSISNNLQIPTCVGPFSYRNIVQNPTETDMFRNVVQNRTETDIYTPVLNLTTSVQNQIITFTPLFNCTETNLGNSVFAPSSDDGDVRTRASTASDPPKTTII